MGIRSGLMTLVTAISTKACLDGEARSGPMGWSRVGADRLNTCAELAWFAQPQSLAMTFAPATNRHSIAISQRRGGTNEGWRGAAITRARTPAGSSGLRPHMYGRDDEIDVPQHQLHPRPLEPARDRYGNDLYRHRLVGPDQPASVQPLQCRGGIEQVDEHAPEEVIGLRQLRVIDIHKHAFLTFVGLQQRGEVCGCQARLTGDRAIEAERDMVRHRNTALDVEAHVRTLADARFDRLDLLRAQFEHVQRRRVVSHPARLVAVTEQRHQRGDAGDDADRVTVAVDEVVPPGIDPGRVIRIVVVQLDVPFGPAVVDHAVMRPEDRILG